MAKNTWIAELMQDINILSQNNKLNLDVSKFQPVIANVETQMINQEQLLNIVDQLGEVVGWVQATSQVKVLNNESITANSPLLNGEWVAQVSSFGKTSYVLEYLGNYQWSLQSCVLQSLGADRATHLAERVVHREVGVKNSRSLVYQRLWSTDSSAPEADMAFFVGFEV